MYYPERILDSRVVFQAMHACLCEAERLQIKSIVIPAFGGLTGRVEQQEIARLMRLAYDYHARPVNEITWERARELRASFQTPVL